MVLLLILTLLPQDRSWAEALATYQRFSGSKEAMERRRAAADLGDATTEKHDKICAQLVGALLRAELAREGANGRSEEKVSGDVLEACIQSLRKISAKEVVAEILKSARAKADNPRFRAYALWGIAPRLEVKDLADLSEDKNAIVQIAAADGLAERGDAATLAPLLKLLAEGRAWEVKVAALRGLRDAADMTAVEPLLETLARARADEGLVKDGIIKVLQKVLESDLDSDDPNAWKSVVLAKKTGSAAASGMTVVEPTEFYGLKTRSTRMVFVLDRTGSMAEPATAPKPGDFKLPADAQGMPKEPPQERQARDEALRIQKKWAAAIPRTRMDIAKREFITTVCLLSPRVTFNVIWFESACLPWRQELSPATWANKLECIRDAEKIQASGSTAIWDALEMAFRMMETPGTRITAIDRKCNYAASIGGVDTIFLMSDGRPNSGRIEKLNEILSELRKLHRLRKTVIHTVCIGTPDPDLALMADGPDPGFLKRIADENGGNFVHLRD